MPIDSVLARIVHQKSDYRLTDKACIVYLYATLEENREDIQFAPAATVYPSNDSHDLTLVELLEQRGMVFDHRLGHFVVCKSWIAKKCHQVEKAIRKTAHKTEKYTRKGIKKTVEFIGDHKKEIAIGAGIVAGIIVGGPLIAGMFTAGGAQAAGALAAGAIGAAAGEEANKRNDKKQPKENEAASTGPDPDPERPPNDSTPLVQQVFGPVLIPPTRPVAHDMSPLKTEPTLFPEISTPPTSTRAPTSPSHSIKTVDRELPHMDVWPWTVISLPKVPGVAAIPVVSPQRKADWIVLCADMNRFKFTQEELEKGTINLYDHLGDFIPETGKEIALVTSQNGINVLLEEFVGNCAADNQKIAEVMLSPHRQGNQQPFYLGIYNPTEGWLKDLVRVDMEKPRDAPDVNVMPGILQIGIDAVPNLSGFTNKASDNPLNKLREMKPKETPTVLRTREFMSGIAQTAEKINPDFRWLIIVHSEAGLIYCRSYEGMPEEIQKIMSENTNTIALGPAEPISNKMSTAVNAFSEKDFVTKRFAKPFMDNPDYDIRIIPCISSIEELTLWIADHARAGTTYDKFLKKQLEELEKEHKFYDGNRQK